MMWRVLSISCVFALRDCRRRSEKGRGGAGFGLDRRRRSGSREKFSSTFTATSNPSRVSRSRYISPMPPAPNGDRIS
jgi:hypothetical protein